jgi:hypothetical protein
MFRSRIRRLPSRRMLAPSAAIFSLLLILTGAAKMARPHDVEKALAALGAPRLAFAGVLIGVLEASVGIAALFYRVSWWFMCDVPGIRSLGHACPAPPTCPSPAAGAWGR